ncbi:MAG: DUF1761 domain-containing protein [Flavobacteriales bacterium]|nr:DUF1761 domain-containing protein [Flavobacteriales bacterium]
MNWLSQGIASASALVIGFIWYGVLFKNVWMKSANMTIEKIKAGYHPALLYGLAYGLAFLVSIGLHRQIIRLHAAFNSVTEYPFFHGVSHGLWDAFIYGGVTTLVTNALFDQKGWKYILINMFYWIITLGVMGGIIGAMG